MNEKMKKMKKVSRILKIVAKIGSVFCMIGIITLVITIVATPYIAKEARHELSGYIEEHGEPISMKFFNKTEVVELKPMLDNFSNAKLSVMIIPILLMPTTGLILVYLLLEKVHKLFNNIYKEETPFTEINVKHVKSISTIILALIIVPVPFGLLFQAISGINLGVSIDLMGIIYALVVIALGYIFEYGYELQKQSDETL
jgi:hypothetical protein